METCCLAKPTNQKANTIENTGNINLKCKNMKKIYVYFRKAQGKNNKKEPESVVAFEFCAIHKILSMFRINTRANFSE